MSTKPPAAPTIAAHEPPPSRALNIDAERTAVIAMCAKHNVPISAIESLLSGGTRVVLMNLADAGKIAAAYRRKLISGAVTRTRWVRNG